nr:S1 RNA-binding domain-containing protein [Thermosipho melanesiensis]
MEEKYPLGNVVTGIVRVVFDKGVIIDIEEGISGYCPISEISWNYISHPTDVIGEGNKVKAVVLDLDKENRKIRLSIKRTVENPWEKFKQQHKVGDIIKVKLVKELKNGYSANVEGIEVYVPKSHIVSDINVSDDLEVKIINIKTDGEILRVVVSEKEKENEKVLDEIKNEAEKERYTSIERKVKNGDSSDSGEE